MTADIEATLDNPAVADALRMLGRHKVAVLDADRDCYTDPETAEMLKEDDLKKLVRQAMERAGETEWEYEGFKATLGRPRTNLSLETDQLTDEDIIWAFRRGVLQLDTKGFRTLMGQNVINRHYDALKAAVHEGEGTRPLSVGPA